MQSLWLKYVQIAPLEVENKRGQILLWNSLEFEIVIMKNLRILYRRANPINNYANLITPKNFQIPKTPKLSEKDHFRKISMPNIDVNY